MDDDIAAALEWSRIDETTVVGRLKAPEDVQLVLEAYSPGAGDFAGTYGVRPEEGQITGEHFIDGVFGKAAHFVVAVDRPVVGAGSLRLSVEHIEGADREVAKTKALARVNDPFPLHQRKQLFRNLGDGRVEDVSDRAGAVFHLSEVGRGAAFGDVDNDGAVDVLVAVNDGPPLLLKNNAAHGNHWLGVRLIGKHANPDAIGARITWQAQDLKRTRLKTGGGSYLASHDPREVLGIGKRTAIDRLEICWPQPSGIRTAPRTVDHCSTLPGRKQRRTWT